MEELKMDLIYSLGVSSMHNLVVIKMPKKKPRLEKDKDIINKLNMTQMAIRFV